MKRLKCLVILLALLLTGCRFNVSESDLENWANEKSGTYLDITSEYSDYKHVESVYLAEYDDDVYIELWNFDNSINASFWFGNSVNKIRKHATYCRGTCTLFWGSFSIEAPSGYYRVLFDDNIGIYAYGSKDEVNSALSSINITK